MFCENIKALKKDEVESINTALTNFSIIAVAIAGFLFLFIPAGAASPAWFSDQKGALYLWGIIDKVVLYAFFFAGIGLAFTGFLWRIVRYLRTIFCKEISHKV